MVINEPIYLGLAGGAASGKTSTADVLAPMARVYNANDKEPIVWSHLYYAMPLYAMAAIRQKTIGADAFDRQCFLLHEALNDLFKGWISYEETVDTVFDLMALECPPEGKPRTFLQQAGTEICRSFDPDCFTKWIKRKSREEHSRYLSDVEDTFSSAGYDPPIKQFGVVVSDARFYNECKFIKDQTKNVLIKFIVRPEVASERIYRRDGVYMTPEQLSHQSEQEISTVSDDMYDAIIDSSDMTLSEQVKAVKKVVEDSLA